MGGVGHLKHVGLMCAESFLVTVFRWGDAHQLVLDR